MNYLYLNILHLLNLCACKVLVEKPEGKQWVWELVETSACVPMWCAVSKFAWGDGGRKQQQKTSQGSQSACLFLAQQLPLDHDLIHRLLYHTQRRTTICRTPLDEWSARPRDLYMAKHYSHQTDIHAPGGIRTHSLSKRTAPDLRLRPSGHWDRPGQSVRRQYYESGTFRVQTDSVTDVGLFDTRVMWTTNLCGPEQNPQAGSVDTLINFSVPQTAENRLNDCQISKKDIMRLWSQLQIPNSCQCVH